MGGPVPPLHRCLKGQATSQAGLMDRSSAPRRPLHVADLGLASRLADIADLSAEDRSSLLHMLDALVTKNRLKALAGDRG